MVKLSLQMKVQRRQNMLHGLPAAMTVVQAKETAVVGASANDQSTV